MRFRIDPVARTATLLEQVTDGRVRDSVAEGSARRLPGGDWVISWGVTNVLSEISARNRPVWRMRLRGGAVNYRIEPIPRGILKASSLRRAMDGMFPR